MQKALAGGSRGTGIVLAGLLLSLVSQAFSDEWDPIEDANADFLGNPCFGANLAVAEMRFLSLGSMGAEPTLLIAITTGEDVVKLYSFDTGTKTLTPEDEITINDPVAWMPTFMTIDITGHGEEPCLVIPSRMHLDSHQQDEPGQITVVRLTVRDNDVLESYMDCFYYTVDSYWNMYYVAKLPSSGYAISTDFGATPPPLGLEKNLIVHAAWSSANRRFEAGMELVLPDMYYGSRHDAIWTRPFVTTCPDFQYGTEFEYRLCITTAHNGGIVIWDPSLDPPIVVSRISDAQQGQWAYDNQYVNGELGDVHRAVVLEGGNSYFSELDDIQIGSRLLFFSDNTMGFIVYDISKPDEPQYVWQWDCDTRPTETDESDWDWHGAGDVTSDEITPALPGDLPGETFGIGVASNSVVEQSPAVIHLYLAGGVDGLRLFDLTEFLDPFGREDPGENSNFDDFAVYHYNSYTVGENVTMQAHDLQTFSEDDNTYVFTSWRESREDESEHEIGLTVHLDEDVICD